jgi:hypothetical protein
MNNFKYEFLSYEAFPNDPYTIEVVEVLNACGEIHPYQHIKMKDGGSFWSFPGCAATKSDGSKKRFNGQFDSRSAKVKFETDLDAFIRAKNGQPIASHHPHPVNQVAVPQNASNGHSQTEAGFTDQNLPF